MKKSFLVCIMIVSAVTLVNQVVAYKTDSGSTHAGTLFRIVENEKFGFINIKGDVVIKPTFVSAEDFSDGLAAARTGGLYGYINASGEFSIPPQFDYGQPFIDGIAIVHRDGKPFYIDRSGKKLFDHPFVSIWDFRGNRAVVRTASGKFGVISKQGKLVIDTAFMFLHEYGNGLYTARGLNDNKEINDSTRIYEHGIINSSGNFLIPYGKYVHFELHENGLLEGREIGKRDKSIYLDENGTIVRETISDDSKTILGDEGCGLIPIGIPKEGPYVEYYRGYMNTRGRIVFIDSLAKYANNFSANRAFIQYDDWKYSVINTHGKVLANKTFTQVLNRGFKNGYAFVKVDGGWTLIDTNINYMFPPKFDEIADLGLINNEYFFFIENNDDGDDLMGIARKDGSILFDPVIESTGTGGFRNGLLACYIKGRLAYISRSGAIVWQEAVSVHRRKNLDIDFMNRAYFTAGSHGYPTDYGGFAGSSNTAAKIIATAGLPTDSLVLLVRPEIYVPFFGSYNGMEVCLANTTGKPVLFNAQDSRLYMNVQALTATGWKDIEYIPNSWCGNSYHVLTLEPGYFWTFATPVYGGELKTKLRIKLTYINPAVSMVEREDAPELILYSNEYEGSINPSQFWRRKEYYPSGLMDPYNE